MLEKVSREIPASFPLGRAWHVVQTEPRSEIRARIGIAALGFDAYTPVYRVQVSHARQKQIVCRPAFARYVFAHFDIERDETWPSIRWVDGVVGVLTNANVPMRIHSDVIDEIKRLESIGFFDEMPSGARFEPGELLRIKDGPFQGFNGEFIHDAKKCVEVMLEFLGAKRAVPVPLEYLEKL